MKTNYVLIDYENVQPENVAALERENIRVVVFVGASQTKIAFEMAAALQRLGANAEYVKLTRPGPNALDFHIAFHLGQLALKDPDAFFHVVSQDTGFDPLLEYMKAKKLRAYRVRSIDDIPLLKAASAKTPADRLSIVVADLQRRGAAKPRALKTLSSTIAALFLHELSEAELAALLGELQAKGLVAVTGTKVSYSLPS